jgi:type II secretory pathway pseudopilin PulG
MQPRGIGNLCGTLRCPARICRRPSLREVTSVRAARRAFSLIDVLVTLAVVALLIGVLIPGLHQAKETTRRIVCASNERQIGLAIAMYADESKNHIPYTVFVPPGARPEDTVLEDTLVLRTNENAEMRDDSETARLWDGLGLLYEGDFLPAPPVFYCPSHTGDHPFTKYARLWKGEAGEIVGNFQYRGIGPNGATKLFQIEPARSALAADGMRTQLDFNHRFGANVLRADLAIAWFSDVGGTFRSLLPESEDDRGSSEALQSAWNHLDNSTSSSDPSGTGPD